MNEFANEIIPNIQEASAQMKRSNEMLESVNKAAAILLDLNINKDIKTPIMSSMEIIGNLIGVDRIHIWRMYTISDDVQFIHEYEWLSEAGKSKNEVPAGLITPFINMSEWESKFKRNEYVGGPFSKLSPEEQEYFFAFDIKSVVIIPIFLDEQLWGLVSVDDCLRERYFTEDELNLMQSLSLMIASAIERHDLFIKDKKSKERMMLMLDTSPLCTQIWDRNLNTIDCNEAGVRLYGFKDKAEYKERFIHCCSPEFQPDGQRSNIKAVMLVNKTFEEGHCVFDWMHQTPDGETQIPAEITLVRAKYGDDDVVVGYTHDLREQKKNEAERMQAHEALKQREAMLTATNKMAEILLSHEDETFVNVMSRGLKPVCEVAGIDRVAVYRLLGDNERFGQIYLWQGKTMPLDDELRVLPDNPAVNRWISVLSNDECINANTMDLPGDEADFLRAFGIKSIFFVPIFMRGKRWGAITLEDHTTYRYIEENFIDLLQSAAHLCAGAIARNEMEREIIQLETENEKLFLDGLTGIYNRRYFDDAIVRLIKSASRTDGVLSLMMIDIDFFKKYNDTYGHMAGDDCLKTAAGVLAASMLRPDDFVARYGGEEFVAVMPDVDETGARTVAERMLKNMQKRRIPHENNDAAKCITFSIGIATGKVERTHSADDFIKLADKMLYKSKQDGRNRYNCENIFQSGV